jgi:hypothetical protein
MKVVRIVAPAALVALLFSSFAALSSGGSDSAAAARQAIDLPPGSGSDPEQQGRISPGGAIA